MESKAKAKSRENLNLRMGESGSMVLQWQGPKGRRLIPVLLKQGLMLLPLSLKNPWQNS
jgi:hypothetical protein